jgi:thiol peroxidase
MALFKLKGSPFNTVGELPATGTSAPDFSLAAKDLSEKTKESFAGKKIILNIFPSVDTPTCAMSVRVFNREAASLTDTVVLCVSMDLPFAHARFCGAEGIANVESLSGFRSDFGKRFGVEIADGPLRGLYARSIVVIDRDGKVSYTELVPETGNEPDYTRALEAAKN